MHKENAALSLPFIAGFQDIFASDAKSAPYVREFNAALEAIDIASEEARASRTAPAAVGTYLETLLTGMAHTPLSNAVQAGHHALDWYQIFAGDGIDQNLADGLVAAQIVGKRGWIRRDDVFIGMFLLAPNICYPLHQHPALEIYYVLSGSINIRHGRAKSPMHVPAGQFSVTPPYQVHELRTGDKPCLIAYLWTGDLTGENWWWEEQPDHSWDRVCWQRQADSSWAVTRREPLSAEEILRAGDA